MAENRAVAPAWPRHPSPLQDLSTPPTPGPARPGNLTTLTSAPIFNIMPHAAARDDGRLKSRTLQGPSAREWAKHRETIIGLYRQYPLKRVRDIMTSRYGFSASKRMYDKRFREWNVFKNVNSDERARAAVHGPASPAGQRDNDGYLSQDDLRRTIRCARTIPPGARRPPGAETRPVTPVEDQNSAFQQPYRQPRRSISISDLLKQEDGPELTASAFSGQHKTFSQLAFPTPDTPGSTTWPGPASPDDRTQKPRDSSALTSAGYPGLGLAAYQAQIRNLFNTPLRPISPDPQTRTMSVITLKLHEYYDWQLANIPEGVVPDEYLGLRSSDESTRYWDTVKNAIYLVKLSAGPVKTPDLDSCPDRRAWSALIDAGGHAAGAMTTQPFDFLRNLFATLSPANTRARPELRGILLRFIASEAQSRLSSNHPITQIAKELQNDQDCQEISQRSLQCMLDIFNTQLGRSKAITFKLLDSLATLLRRDGQYPAGLEIIKELLDASRPAFGPDSDQARSVENELAHFYMLADEHDLALGHCMSVVTKPPPPSPEASSSSSSSESQAQPTFYQDGIAAHAMEDIAQIHQRRGDLEQCIAWLERASSIALVVWGPKAVATGHLIDKMTNLQRQFGKDLLESATMWEAAIF
ncbi:hypothetical protein N658DRAFT_495729 [Parathielavia hyrcaniae]|uniref:Clr5 domain-containing protein n=1 Tax=Parathielavia hyrcaniae TaxID=113614 RepID=A0AAN6Q1H2_9PEZI|nr:hypothetical protein N658DRAFT_495729 [Parathielavia hyrcaniae]